MMPLPTEPNTVIRVHYFDPAWDSELVLGKDGQWWTPGATSPTRADHLPLCITGFEVIAKPIDPDYFEPEDPISARVRRETAKAVLDRVRKVHHSAGDLSIPARFRGELDHIARDFNVE